MLARTHNVWKDCGLRWIWTIRLLRTSHQGQRRWLRCCPLWPAVILLLLAAEALIGLPPALGLHMSQEASVHAPAPIHAQEDMAVEDEVMANILQQPIGNHTVGDLNLPEPFLRRVADRIIRKSFEERHRLVYRDAAAKTPPRPDEQQVQNDALQASARAQHAAGEAERMHEAASSGSSSIRAWVVLACSAVAVGAIALAIIRRIRQTA